ncbi:MAG: hypothetical protein QM528_06495 [Phycisphaerales bacterium]|nr:hypothetical protein [Phycisphaerales bacterium]
MVSNKKQLSILKAIIVGVLVSFLYACKKATVVNNSDNKVVVNPALMLVSPASNAKNQNVQPIFTWNNTIQQVKYFKIYFGTNPFNLIEDKVNYKDTTAFSDTVRLDIGIGTAYFNYNTYYYWKVEGHDAHGNLIYTTPVDSFIVRSSINMPTARGYLSAVVNNNLLYAIGGKDNTGVLAVVESYNDTFWKAEPSLNTARAEFGATVYNNSPYVAGGSTNALGTELSSIEYFNGTSWQYNNNFLTSGRYGLGMVVYNGNVYVAGGNNGTAIDSVEYFNTNTVSQGPLMNEARFGFGTTVANNQIYAIGGYGSSILSSVESFNGSTWSSAPSLDVARGNLAAVTYNNTIYAIGGGYNGNYLNIVEKFNGSSWELETNMPTPRAGAGVAVFNDKIYVLGGVNGANYLDIVEIYNPETNQWE